MGYLQGEGRTQATLFPVTLEELIPDDHVCRVIDVFVGRLDMDKLVFLFGPRRPRLGGQDTIRATC